MGAEHQLVPLQPDHTFMPACPGGNRLPYGECVEKLIGHNQQRPVIGQGGDIVMPDDMWVVFQRLLLTRAPGLPRSSKAP